METVRAFDSLALTAIQTQLDTPADTKDLVRIEVVRRWDAMAQASKRTKAARECHGRCTTRRVATARS